MYGGVVSHIPRSGEEARGVEVLSPPDQLAHQLRDEALFRVKGLGLGFGVQVLGFRV